MLGVCKCKLRLFKLGVCKEFVRSIQRYSIEMRAVRNFVEEFEGFD